MQLVVLPVGEQPQACASLAGAPVLRHRLLLQQQDNLALRFLVLLLGFPQLLQIQQQQLLAQLPL